LGQHAKGLVEKDQRHRKNPGCLSSPQVAMAESRPEIRLQKRTLSG
jgi:hypothetical protein